MRENKIDFGEPLTRGGRILYHIEWALVWLLSLIPFRVMYLLSDILFLLVYYVVGYRKKLVRKNLSQSFPDKSEKELREIERRFYHWFCDYIHETLKLASISEKEMRKRVIFDGLEYVEEAFDKGHNVAVFLGHYCNWEWVIALGLHLDEKVWVGQVIHELDNKPLDSVFRRLRAVTGNESCVRDIILRRIVQVNRIEKRKMLVGFIADQAPIYQSAHYWTDFLNHPDTLVLTGAERIAKKCNFSSVYFDLSRPKRGYYHIKVVPMALESDKYPDYELTEMFYRLFEKSIQRQPEFWLWTHNRWKRTLEGLETYNREVNKTHNRTAAE